EQGNASLALKLLQDKTTVSKDAGGMKYHYLMKKPVDSVKAFQKIYPNDTAVAKVLVKKLNYYGISEKDKMLQEYLIQEFNIPRDKPADKIPEKKSSYNIAVLFPFMLNQPGGDKNNQFVLDLYDGIKIAV